MLWILNNHLSPRWLQRKVNTISAHATFTTFTEASLSVPGQFVQEWNRRNSWRKYKVHRAEWVLLTCLCTAGVSPTGGLPFVRMRHWKRPSGLWNGNLYFTDVSMRCVTKRRPHLAHLSAQTAGGGTFLIFIKEKIYSLWFWHNQWVNLSFGKLWWTCPTC